MTAIQQVLAGAAAGNPDGVALDGSNPFDTAISPSSASATYALNSNGTSVITGDVSPSNWIDNTSNASLYEVRATRNSGSTPTGTFNSWLALSSSRSWSLGRSGAGTSVSNVTFEVRRASTGIIVDSVTVNFGATVEF